MADVSACQRCGGTGTVGALRSGETVLLKGRRVYVGSALVDSFEVFDGNGIPCPACKRDPDRWVPWNGSVARGVPELVWLAWCTSCGQVAAATPDRDPVLRCPSCPTATIRTAPYRLAGT